MDTNQQIRLIINAVQSEPGDEALKQQRLVLVNKLLEAANKYVAIVVQQGFLLQVHEGTTDRAILATLATLDQTRSRTHDSLISQIAIVNRLCAAYGLDPLYTGSEARRDKGSFALELITDYFWDRI